MSHPDLAGADGDSKSGSDETLDLSGDMPGASRYSDAADGDDLSVVDTISAVGQTATLTAGISAR